MTNRTLRSITLLSALGAAHLVVWAAGCRASGEDAPNDAPAASSDAASGDAGLPCEIEEFLAARCTSCHGASPTVAPMPLVTYANLVAPAKSDPSKKVGVVALERLRSEARPMPPSNKLAATDFASFASWVEGGMAAGTCGGRSGRADSGAPECVLASDCPGTLVCRNGTCDVECITDKDCTPGSTCEETRCQDPAARGGTDAGPVTKYSDFTSSSAWTTYDLAGLTIASYSGVTFDGRYVYYAPDYTSGRALRYDTGVPFTSMRGWATFDLTTMSATAKGYRGIVFDGRYVYYVPFASGQMARFDTRGAYLDPASWAIFDLTSIAASVTFQGAVFDGRWIYLVPTSTASTPAVRYDTQAVFTSASAWTTFSPSTVKGEAYGFLGGVFDGRYVYYVPGRHASGPHGTIARFDTELAFDVASSWSTFDMTSVNANAAGYRSGAFDGRYLYLVPGYSATTPVFAQKTIARFDTRAPFTRAESWSFFDLAGVSTGAAGYNAATFDGRHLVFAPGYNGTGYHGLALRYDTQRDLAAAASWSTFDTTSLATSLVDFRGNAFDGHYMYFAPTAGRALRFEARTGSTSPVSAMPGGSFY